MNKEWISVHDDLPEPEETVVFCTKLDTFSGCLNCSEEGELSWFACAEDFIVDKVTHWMPLPPTFWSKR